MLITFFVIFAFPKLIMKKIFASVLFLITQNLYSVNIDSVNIQPINCNGDPTCVTVYTDASSGTVFYDFYIKNLGVWLLYPGSPFSSGSQFQLCNQTAGEMRVVTFTSQNLGSPRDTLDFMISQPGSISSIQSTQNISCFGANDGSLSLTTYLGTPPYTLQLSNGTTRAYSGSPTALTTINNLTAGNYTYSITDANGCSFSGNPVSFSITNPQQISVSLVSQQNASCFGSNDGQATISASGGTATYTYLWSDGQTTPTATNLTAGNYTCTVTDGSGCSVVSQNIVITQPSNIGISFGAVTHVSCLGGSNGSTRITASGGNPPYTYLWTNGQTNRTATGLSAGTYRCTITDASGCSRTSTQFVINEPDSAITISQNTTDVTCNGGNDGSISLNVLGGDRPYSYVWSNGSISNPNNNLSAGSYSVSVTDSRNCTESLTNIVVNQPNSPISSTIAVDSTSCFGVSDGSAQVVASGGTPPYTITWSNGKTGPSIDSLSFGVYSYSVRDNSGCNSAFQNFVVYQPSIISTTINTVDVSCNTFNNGSANVSVSGGTSPYSYNFYNEVDSFIGTGPTINGLVSGNYYVTISDINSCIDSSSFSITQPTSLSITQTITSDVKCKSGNDGTATVNVTGGTPPYTYFWSDGQTTRTAIGLIAGSYNCLVTDANGCTIRDDSLNIFEPSLELIVTENTYNTTCFGSSNGSASLGVSGGLPPYSINWSNGQNIDSITGLSQGIYNYTVTDNNGCVITESVSINQPDQINNNISIYDVSCFGGNDGSATSAPTGGTPPYSYSWSTTVPSTLPSIGNLNIGNYQLIVTDRNGCQRVSNLIIGQPTQLTVTEVIKDVSCNAGNDGQISLNISGGNPFSSGPNYIINWSNGQTTNPAINLNRNFYNVTILDSTNCLYVGTYQVNEPLYPLNVNLEVENVTCNGYRDGEITVTPSGGTPPYTYSWPNGQNSQTLPSLFAGVYNVNVKDNNGCEVNAIANVIEPSPLNFSYVSLPTSCFNFSDGSLALTVTGGTTPYSYLWNNGSTTSSISNLTAGTYSALVLDSNRCPLSTGNLDVIQPNEINATINATNLLCNSDSNGILTISTVSGASPPYTYLWSTGQNTPIISNLKAGNYDVTITDGSGCNNTFSNLITQPSQITSTFSVNNITTTGANNGSITSFPIGGTPPYTYSWTGPNNFTSNTRSINNLQPGVYSLEIIDKQFCTKSFTQIITEPNCNIVIDSTYIEPKCYGDLAQISWTNSNGIPPYSNSLYNTNGVFPTSINGSQFTSTNNPVQLPVGVWQLVVVDAVGCAGILNLPVVSPDSINVSLTINDVSCYGLNDGTVSELITGGTAPYSVDWGGLNPNQLYNGNYNMVVTDANGCSSGIKNFDILQPDPLTIDSVQTTKVSCVPGNDGTATVFVSGGNLNYTYNWNNGQFSQTATNLLAGTYIVDITDDKGCNIVSNNINILNSVPLTVSISENSVTCNGSNDGALKANIITGTKPVNFSWFDLTTPSLVISTDSTIENLFSGGYSVLVVDKNGCIAQQNYFLIQPNNLQFSLVSNNVSLNGANDGSISINSLTGGTAPYYYSWTGPNGYSSSLPNISNLKSGNYSVTITDSNGCSSSLSEIINEPNCNVQINEIVTQPLCNGQSGILSWSNSGGGAPYNNILTNLSNNQIYFNQPFSSTIPLVEGHYSLLVEDQYGCLDMVNVIIQSPDPIVANTTTNDVTCFQGTNGSVNLSTIGGTPPYNIDYGGVNINALSAGTYAITISDINSCSTIVNYTINQPNDISISSNTTPVSCHNGSDGTAFAVANGGTPPYTYFWTPSGSNNQFISNLNSGNYYVTATDVYGCSSTQGPQLITINQPIAPVTTSTISTNASCFGYNDGTAQIFTSGGSGPYTYLWSNGLTTSNVSNLSKGSYSCIVNDVNNCATTETITINHPDIVSANITTTDVSCNSGSNGTASVNPSGGSGTYLIEWYNRSQNFSINGLGTGSYFVFVKDNRGCNTNASPVIFEINEPDSLDVTTSIEKTVSCINGADGSISSITTGGSRPYSYSWYDFANNIVSNDSVANNLVQGQYLLVVVDSNGCIDSSTIVLGSASGVTANFIVDTISCVGGSDGSLTIVPSGGTPPYSYTWSSTGSTTNTSTGLSSGITYYVSVTDANGCPPDIFSSTVPELNPISIDSFSIKSTSCYNGNDGRIDINRMSGGSSPYSLFWSNAQFGNSCINVSSDNYNLRIVDGNGCIDSSFSFFVPQPSKIISNINIIDSVTCLDGNDGTIIVTPSGGTGTNYNYLWSDSTTNNINSNLTVGQYHITIFDSLNCKVTDTLYLDAIHKLSLSFNTISVSCSGTSTGSSSALVVGGNAPYQFLWSNGNTTQSIFGLPASTYTCLVTDSNGCTIRGNTTVTQSATTLTIDSISKINLSCFDNNSGKAIVYASGGSGNYSYLWNDINIQTTQSAINLYADTFIVNVSDSSNCTVSDTVIIYEPSLINPSLNYNDINCFGNANGNISLSNIGGTPPYNISWTGPNLFTSNQTNLSNLEKGFYYLNLTDNKECDYLDTVFIYEPEPLTIVKKSDDPLCYNDSNGVVSLKVDGGTTPYTATMGSYNASYPSIDSIVFNNLFAGNNNITIVDSNGCQNYLEVILTNPTKMLIISDSISSPTCYSYNNGSIFTNVVGGKLPYTFEFTNSNGNIISNSSQVNNLSNGMYDFIVKDLNNCTISKLYEINEPDEILITLENLNNVDCYGESTGSIEVSVNNAKGNYQIFWTNSSKNTLMLNNISSNSYKLTIIDENNCAKTDSFFISQNDSIYASIQSSNSSCAETNDGSIEILSINGGTGPFDILLNNIKISENQNNFLIDNLQASAYSGSYNITISDLNGCSITNSIYLDFNGGFNCINESSIISPNFDNINDEWQPVMDINDEIEVIILNRWGKQEFYYKGNNMTFTWNGTSNNGEVLVSGDYYYIIKFKNSDYADITGVITLVK